MKQLFLGTLCLALISSPAYAKEPHGEKGDKHEKSETHGHGRDDHRDHGRKFHDHHRDHHGASARPTGWDKGKKTGWGNCDVPPGQAKKVGCHPHRHEYHNVRHREPRDDHQRDHRTRPVYTHYPRPTGTTTTTTTTTTATNKGEHPFVPTLRRKQEDEARLRRSK